MEQGGWEAEIHLYEWRNREINFSGDTLYFSCYAPEAIRPEAFPRLLKEASIKALKYFYRELGAGFGVFTAFVTLSI